MLTGGFGAGIFAIRDIEAGEEFTFDYQFERYGDVRLQLPRRTLLAPAYCLAQEHQTCCCGAPACRGVIGVKREGVGLEDRQAARQRAIRERLQVGHRTLCVRDQS